MFKQRLLLVGTVSMPALAVAYFVLASVLTHLMDDVSSYWPLVLLATILSLMSFACGLVALRQERQLREAGEATKRAAQLYVVSALISMTPLALVVLMTMVLIIVSALRGAPNSLE